MRFSFALTVSMAALVSCNSGGGGGGGGSPIAARGEYQVFAWNDLGMHCLNPSYDRDVILPPYNDLRAQVVRRGSPPEIVTAGLTVEYRVLGNTRSYGKGSFGGFWDNMEDLFGMTLPHDEGLNLVDPDIHNGLAGTMVARSDGFVADGIPVTPIGDDGTWNPYQVAEITVKDGSGNVVARTETTIPTSDELHCDKCHRSAAAPGAPRSPYLELHDAARGTDLASRTTPFLCASSGCHASPALGQSAGAGVTYLSAAIHGFHGGLPAAEQPACYDCHPGSQTKCNRSLRHTADDGNCTACHGDLAHVGATIAAGRVPWVDEPKCSACHPSSIPEVDTGSVRYRDAAGHGGLGCPACHSSPHAMVPSRVDSDNFQAIQLQGKAVTIGSCAACHGSSRGDGLHEFGEVHGGTNPERRIACHVCHTQVSTATAQWPHGFKWQGR